MGAMENLRERWTRHSMVLLGAGAIYISLGVSFLNATPVAKKAPSLKVALQVIPLQGWAGIYIGVGCLAFLAAFLKFRFKVYGYMVLSALSCAWAFFYVMAIFFEGAPKTTWIVALIFTLLAYIWITVSGLVSPERARELVEEAVRGSVTDRSS